ncbi:MAG: riboflavin synthase [Syntrophomonadaceae bacterium]|nr:riboflavin synthase [Bacillota bacterium]NLP25128.1 riboflavin synthase [Syntrophomonadaceae bacterium]
MFTGIIEEIGHVQRINQQSHSAQIQIKASKVLSDVAVGDSIAVNGVCLTVVSFDNQHFIADVMPETINKTTLHELKPGSPVNLERALQVGARLGGHIVQGHVDAIGTIVQKQVLEIAIIYRIKTTPELLQFVVPKGSVAIDGISLTVVDVFQDSFTVSLIPHTAHETTLGGKDPGDRVNLESDIIGRYVQHLMGRTSPDMRQDLDVSFLAENGFL